MACIKKIQIEDTIYIANVDFRTAIRCNEIAEDDKIGDFERVLGIICTMFGSESMDKCKKKPEHIEKLLKWALNYLSCGQEIEKSDDEPDMDFVEDMDYIEASFMSDYSRSGVRPAVIGRDIARLTCRGMAVIRKYLLLELGDR